MAKVIEKRTEHIPKPVKHTCKRCKSKIEFDHTDIKYSSDPREITQSAYVVCPVCNTYIDKKVIW